MTYEIRWDEFDLEAGSLSLPDERMKMRVTFVIPLAAQVIDRLRGESSFSSASSCCVLTGFDCRDSGFKRFLVAAEKAAVHINTDSEL